ncbi:MAG: type II toxin-antitoxin system Phd/YefM family antitoxin [Desulfobacterium sp.]|nr:type II toxin-antitoxin system Phd/YefM family antitoxin [Desulfobacterium sp.]MBU3948622.1 type II toxin-antitoxin system Phd/YefM family antitoxin [Pseudomonadota bacterium]MBU4036047.1 type II toxin-antitoxin system Phd/YefM family antitoxin [Pseudomonadota bacterium]
MNTQFIIDELGNKTAVILPVQEYEGLLEDIHDLAIIAERKNEPSISFVELKKRLMADGGI